MYCPTVAYLVTIVLMYSIYKPPGTKESKAEKTIRLKFAKLQKSLVSDYFMDHESESDGGAERT